MTIEVTEKDLDNLTGLIKIYGKSHFKDITGQECLAQIRLLDGIIDLANRVLKAKEDANTPVISNPIKGKKK